MTEQRPRVALVLATSTGGVGVHVRSLTGYLLGHGWAVTVCGPAATDALFGFAAAGAEFRAVRLRSRPGAELLAGAALRRALPGAALVHAHGLRAGVAAVLTGRRPLVVSWHNAVLADGLTGRVLAFGERLVARRATVTLAASADLAARVRELGGRDVRVVPVAPPTPHPRRDRAAVRAELGVDAGRPLVVSVGRLHPQKAHDVLIAAAARWRGRRPPPLVVIAGDGPSHEELAEQIRRLDAPVRLLGRRADIADLLAGADVMVLASRWEARPLAVQEAMALGVAVVATAVGGVPELVGDAARLIPAGDVSALDAAVRDLLDDPDARAELGGRGRRRASGEWPDETAAAAVVEAVYRELLGSRPGAGAATRRRRRSC